MNISQFFKDDTGQLSSTRLAFLVWALGVFGTWLYVSIINKTLEPLPESIVEMTVVFMTGKVAHSFSENL